MGVETHRKASLKLSNRIEIMHNNNSMGDAYADIRPTEHNLKDLNQIMSVRNKSELSTLRAVNDLASTPYSDVVKTQGRWQAVKNGALIVSLMLLVITMILLGLRLIIVYLTIF